MVVVGANCDGGGAGAGAAVVYRRSDEAARLGTGLNELPLRQHRRAEKGGPGGENAVGFGDIAAVDAGDAKMLDGATAVQERRWRNFAARVLLGPRLPSPELQNNPDLDPAHYSGRRRSMRSSRLGPELT